MSDTRATDPNGTIVRKDLMLKIMMGIASTMLVFFMYQNATWQKKVEERLDVGTVNSAWTTKVEYKLDKLAEEKLNIADYRREMDEVKGSLNDIHTTVDEVKDITLNIKRKM